MLAVAEAVHPAARLGVGSKALVEWNPAELAFCGRKYSGLSEVATIMTKESVRVGIIGDFEPNFPPHQATNDALEHAACALGTELQVEWLPTASLERRTAETIGNVEALGRLTSVPTQTRAHHSSP